MSFTASVRLELRDSGEIVDVLELDGVQFACPPRAGDVIESGPLGLPETRQARIVVDHVVHSAVSAGASSGTGRAGGVEPTCRVVTRLTVSARGNAETPRTQQVMKDAKRHGWRVLPGRR